MKILFVTNIGIEAGGLEKYILELKKGLEEKGHTVKIFSGEEKEKNKNKFNDFGYAIKNGSLLHNFINHIFNISSFLSFKKAVDDYDPDIIHIHSMHESSASILFALKNKPTIITVHGPEGFLRSQIPWRITNNFYIKNNKDKQLTNLTFIGKVYYYFYYFIEYYIYKMNINKVKVFIAPSTFYEKEIKKITKNVILLPNGINLFPFSKTSHFKNLLYVGRLEENKGIEYLIRAFAIIQKQIPDAELNIIGDGGQESYLKKIVCDMKLVNIKFSGWIDADKLYPYYKNSSILIVPSLWPEPFGLVGIEAMSIGRPVVASNVGGISDWLADQKTGYLVDPKNSQQIAEKTIVLLFDKRKLITMGERGHENSAKFDIKIHIDKLLKIYNGVING